eukprot:9228_1
MHHYTNLVHDFDALIGIDDILFLFYVVKWNKIMKVKCFDLLNRRIYNSEKTLPSKMWHESRRVCKMWEKNFVGMTNGFVYYINTTNTNESQSYRNIKISMYDLVPDELRILRET